MTRRWRIDHASREYAREVGDPLLGTAEAEPKDEAERLAVKRGLGVAGAGCWAVEDVAASEAAVACCIAHREDGCICGAPATVLDVQRGGMVCGEHVRGAA